MAINKFCRILASRGEQNQLEWTEMHWIAPQSFFQMIQDAEFLFMVNTRREIFAEEAFYFHLSI